MVENNENGKKEEKRVIKELRDKGYKVIAGVKIFIRLGANEGLAAIADFVYVDGNKIIFGEIKSGDHARFSQNQKAVYDGLLNGRVEFQKISHYAALGIEKNATKIGYRVGLSVFANASSRAIRQSNTLWAKAASKTTTKKVIAGAFSLLGSSAAAGAELLLYSSKPDEGSDCPMCLDRF